MNVNAIWLIAAISGLSVGFAQETATQLDPVVVEAKRIPSDPSRTGASLTVLTAEDLAPFGNRPLGETLRSIPGIHFAQSGPRGSLNTLVIRGSSQKYMLIRIDGVNISDPSTSQVEPLVQHVLTSDIERIEVLRGPQSSLYGGQAVAGVIEITTKQAAQEGFSAQLTAEGGSFDTLRGALSAQHAGEKGSIRVSVEHLESDGFSAADEDTGAIEEDGYENTTVSARGTYDVSSAVTLKALVRHSEFLNEFDGFTFGVGPTDALGEETEGHTTQVMGGVTATVQEGRQVHDLQLTYFDIERDTRGEFPALFTGDRIEADYVGSQEVAENLIVLFGVNGYEEAIDNGTGLQADSTIIGGFAQVELEPMDPLTLSATGRFDDHSDFGSEVTWRSTVALDVTESTRFRGSGGTGFRAPSLFELFDASFGNPDLKPETSIGWDVGIDQSWSEDRWAASVTYYDLTLEDKIEFLFPQGFTTIDGESQTSGVEASLQGQLCESVAVSATYTWSEQAEDAQGNPLLRVPEHDVALMMIYTQGDWSVSSTASYIAGVVDLDYAGGVPTSELPSYWVVDGFVSCQITPTVQAYVRLANLLDEDYHEIRGYGTADRSFFAGVQLDL